METCLEKGYAFKKENDSRSTLAGSSFKNCVHVKLDQPIKIFPQCMQINHSHIIPKKTTREALALIKKKWTCVILRPILISVSRHFLTHTGTFDLVDMMGCINETFSDFTAVYVPKNKGRDGLQILCRKNCNLPIELVYSEEPFYQHTTMTISAPFCTFINLEFWLQVFISVKYLKLFVLGLKVIVLQIKHLLIHQRNCCWKLQKTSDKWTFL